MKIFQSMINSHSNNFNESNSKTILKKKRNPTFLGIYIFQHNYTTAFQIKPIVLPSLTRELSGIVFVFTTHLLLLYM